MRPVAGRGLLCLHTCASGGTGLASVVMAVAGAPADQGVSDRLEHGDVVAVGAVEPPAHRYAVTLGGDRPLPAELGPIRWIGAPVPSPHRPPCAASHARRH